MDRVLSTTKRLNARYLHQPSSWENKRGFRGLLRMMAWMTKNTKVRRYYWRNTIRAFFLGPAKFDFCQQMMAVYMHFQDQSAKVILELDHNIEFATNHAPYPRMLGEDIQRVDERSTGSFAAKAECPSASALGGTTVR